MRWVQFAANKDAHKSALPRVAMGTLFPTHQIGGTEVLVKTLATGLSACFDIVLVSPESAELLDTRLQGVLFAHVELPKDIGHGNSAHLVSMMRAHQVRLMHFHIGGLHGWQTGYFHLCPIPRLVSSGIAIALTTHGLIDAAPNVGLNQPRLVRKMLQCYAWASRATISELSRGDFFVSHHNLEVAKKRTFPAGRKMDCIYHSRLPDNHPCLPDKEKTILCVATIAESKGQLILLNAFCRLAQIFPDWKLQFVGRTHCTRYLDALKQVVHHNELSKRVSFHEAVEFEALSEFYARASVFVLPSLQEGLGLTLQEAMFFGCAVVGSNVGGIPELVIHNSTGLLVPPSDPQALSAALEIMLADPAKRGRFGRAGQTLLSQKGMSTNRMLHRYRDLYVKWLFAA